MRQSAVFVTLSVLTLVAAQNNNFTVDPNTIKPGTRAAWCNAEFNTCGILCGGNPIENSCTPSDLKFSCKCQNGTAPGLEYYIQTMPTFLCSESYANCVKETTSDSQAQNKCETDILAKCGTLDPANAVVGGGSSEDAASSVAPSGSAATSGAVASTSTQPAAAPTHAASLGNGVAAMAAGVLAAALL